MVEDVSGFGKRMMFVDDNSDSDSAPFQGSVYTSLSLRTAATDVQSWK